MVISWTTTSSAISHRTAANEANNLRHSAATVAFADAMYGATGSLDNRGLAEALATLDGEHDRALARLDSDERSLADAEITAIVNCGMALRSGDVGEMPPHDHDDLAILLDAAATRASNMADQAETRARYASIVSFTAAMLAAATSMRWRQRVQRDELAARAEIKAGLRTEALLNDSPEVIVVIAPDGSLSYASASLARTFGPNAIRTIDDIVAHTTALERVSLHRHLRGEGAIRRSRVFRLHVDSGDLHSFEVRVSDLTDDTLVDGHLVTMRDVTHELALKSTLQRQALIDELTGLPNRRALEPELERAKSTVRNGTGVAALLMLDLDGFKATNDTLGHAAGDRLLQLVTRRLSDVLRDDETLLRLGGDEFALVASRARDIDAVMKLAERLLETMRLPFRLHERSESLRTSIGIAIVDDAERSDDMLRHADTALYEAKRRGGDMAVVFEPQMNHELDAFNAMGRALRSADFDREFRLVYQPIFDTTDGRLSSVETLLRWDSPVLGSVSPAEFIPVAEKSGLICEIGHWVLAGALEQIQAWDAAGMDSSVKVSVNVSNRQISEPRFADGVLAMLHEFGIEPGRLVLEVTETAMLENGGHGLERIERLRQAGVRFALDDFGTGYSNMEKLLTLPFDILKIDRSLLMMLGEMREQTSCSPGEPCAILGAIVSIASALGAPIVAEGVETEAQLTNLKASGVAYVQGFLLGRPDDASKILASSTSAVATVGL